MGLIKDCLFQWDVSSSLESVSRAQVIIALSFGRSSVDISNEYLANKVAFWHRYLSLPLILQWEVADCLAMLDAYVIRKHHTEGKYLDTREVLAQAVEICKRRGWSNVLLITNSEHRWRAKKTAERLGLRVVFVHDTSGAPYDVESDQWRARSKWRFMVHEIPARFYYLIRGWI